MNRRFGVLAAAVCGMLLGFPGAQAADTWPVVTSWDAVDVSVRLATARGELVVQPGEFNLRAGELYRFVIVNDSGVKHSLSAPKLAGKVLISDLASTNIVSGVVMRPGERVEWYLMPVTEGTYKFGCANSVHAASGMETTMHVL
ncbi:MAG: hypothetical protein GWP69_06040 [Gammaproteobacteria bacterium]|nr:hypothetical protein [Gammaproteobacteria bacterium]NCF82483.1 hypothetical protein [Pseudomonadota bacterium]